MSKWCFALFVAFLSIRLRDVTAVNFEYYDNAEDTEDIGLTHIRRREGKIFSRELWGEVQKGLKETTDLFSRVSDNLEVAFDQISDNFEDNLSSFADKVEERVGEALPPYLRQDTEEVEEGPIRQGESSVWQEGVDDGLELYNPVQEGFSEEDEEGSDTEETGSQNPPLQYVFQRPGANIFRFGAGGFNPFDFGRRNIFSLFNRRDWWRGPNVCVDREETDENEFNGTDETDEEVPAEAEMTDRTDADTEGDSDADADADADAAPMGNFQLFSGFKLSSCTDSGDRYVCVNSDSQRGLHKTVKVTYRCCHGFVRDGSGCSKVDLTPMPKTLEDLDTTTDFLSLVKAADMVDFLTASNLTLFVPNNEAIQEYTADLEEKNEIQSQLDGMRNSIYLGKPETPDIDTVLLSHMTDGFLYAGDFEDELTIPSLADSSLRLNLYSHAPPVATVNCARITKANHHSLHGVVHIIDRVLSPVRSTLADIISEDPQFTILKNLLTNSDILEELRGEGQMTFIAPNDAAFRRMEASVVESLMDGSACLDAILKNHLLPNTICAAAVQGRMKTLNQLGDYLIVERDEEDQLSVGGAQVVTADVLATNGVLHIIDEILMPNQAKSVEEVLNYHNLTKFIDLLRAADLLQELNAQKDITIFAPSNKAIEKLSEDEMLALMSDKIALQERLRYHVTSPTIHAKSISNNHLATTTADKPLRINLYSSVPLLSGLFRTNNRNAVRATAGCQRISVVDSQACGAVVNIVEGLLQVPSSNVLEELGDEKYSIFRQMVSDIGMDEELTDEGPYTVLVPSDHAFRTLPEEELSQILEDEELKEKIVRRHILKEHICCSGINSNNWLFMDRKRTIDGSQLHIRKTHNNRLMAGPARIISCGAPTANGIVHTLSRFAIEDREMAGAARASEGGNFRRIPMPDLRKIFFF